MEKAIQRCSFVVLVVFVCFAAINQGYGAIDWWGDVDPPDPSTWTSSTTAYIGRSADGGISVTEGDDIEAYWAYLGYNASASGIATVDGTDSTWSCSKLFVGYSGHGTLNITNGGNVSCLYGYIGDVSGSTGSVSVDGAGSRLSSYWYLHVGYGGQGTLEISNGGYVNCDEGYIGRWGGSTGDVSVDGAGSRLSCGDKLRVGYYGQGILEIIDGGTVSCGGSGYVGHISGSTGEVSVDGAGSSWNCDWNLYVGYDGQGTLEITNGGLVKVEGTLTIDYNEDGDSFIRMATGAMLALYGDADTNNDHNITIDEFLAMVEGTDEIEYWDGTGWSNITNATAGEDYFIEYHNDGDLAGYTVLTVTAVPEPATLMLLLFGAGIVSRKNRK